MTVLEGIQKSAEFLARKQIESPRLQAELLLAHVLKLPRMQLYLNFERALAPAETDHLRELVRRRGLREPLQQITGSTSFCGLEIAVNRSVLVPRPETELLAEQGWQFLSGLNASSPVALDVGTGSGCIAVALAAKCPGARIDASDISPEALETARRNAAANGVADRVQFFAGDRFAGLAPGTAYDLIISNPPYIPTAEIATIEPEVRDYEPRTALDGGADGLDLFRWLAVEAGSRLKAGGRLMVEFGDGQGDALRALFAEQNWVVEAIREDYTRRPRLLIARR